MTKNINKYVDQILQSASEVAQSEGLSNEEIQAIFNQLPGVYQQQVNAPNEARIDALVSRHNELIQTGDLIKHQDSISAIKSELRDLGHGG